MMFLFNRVNLRLFHRHQFSKVRPPLNLAKFLTEIVIWAKYSDQSAELTPNLVGLRESPPKKRWP